MNEQILNLAFLLPVVLLFFSNVVSSKNSGNQTLSISKFSSLLGITFTLIGGFWINYNGNFYGQTYGYEELGLSIRLDGLSLVMYGMVSLIGLVVSRYSDSYLEGDKNRGKFIGGLAVTVGLVQLMVISGNLLILLLAWIAAGVSLRKLIVFYSKREKAVLAAQKKKLVSIFGNLALVGSFALLYLEFETGDLKSIFQSLSSLTLDSVSQNLEIAAILLVLSAALKSAQLPFHGWLLEVMEAPTPVSALLHAGLLNAGPFLMIRFAFLLDATEYASIILFTIGAITAFYGAIVFITQPTIKNSLAYSSIAHMGFSMMSSGLGAYAAGLLHLVAHSFYKAHSFLSSGSLVEKVRTNSTFGYKRSGSLVKILLGFVLAISLFILISTLWGISLNSNIQLLLIGGVILGGVKKLLVSVVDSMSFLGGMIRVVTSSIIVLNMFYGLETVSHLVINSEIPTQTSLSLSLLIPAITVFAIFFITILIQSISPILKAQPFIKRLGIHARQGFYLNTYFNKAIKSLDKRN